MLKITTKSYIETHASCLTGNWQTGVLQAVKRDITLARALQNTGLAKKGG
jgi:hypothetical protein